MSPSRNGHGGISSPLDFLAWVIEDFFTGVFQLLDVLVDGSSVDTRPRDAPIDSHKAESETQGPTYDPQIFTDAVAALRSLGMKATEAKQTVSRILSVEPYLDVVEVIKRAVSNKNK